MLAEWKIGEISRYFVGNLWEGKKFEFEIFLMFIYYSLLYIFNLIYMLFILFIF